MRQIDIINELNKMVIGYNITWDMIKYDADRAIMRINAHLGAEYPMMSEIMLSPEHRYTIRTNSVDVPIFPERYILTVVIPFIATEVLARDEEFTTIYNKYAMDFENGLFDMFQNEFNKVPLVFRQDPDIGVFFDKGIKEHKKRVTMDKNLQEFKFNVYYHLNADYIPDAKFTVDTAKYDYKSDVTVKASTVTEFIKGLYHYGFAGWYRNPECTGETVYQADEKITEITSDIHLYARWTETCVLSCTADGVVSLNEKYKNKITSLEIPTYVPVKDSNGTTRVTAFAEDFTVGATKLVYVSLPKTSFTINANAFNNNNIRTLLLPPYDYLRDTPHITIKTNGIISSNIDYLYIPYGIDVMEADAIQDVQKIQCERDRRPDSWSADDDNGNPTWTDCTDIDWGVANG